MYQPAPDSGDEQLALLQQAEASPQNICGEDPEVREAFEEGLRQLAEDIIEYHPSIAHVLLGMNREPVGVVQGQN